MQRHIDEVEFTIFDTETTGLEPGSGDRIIELAAIRFKAGERIAELQSLVNPHRDITAAAFQVNHISQEMVSSAEDMAAVMPRFLDFIRGSCLCSYNAPFDMGFLNNELRLLGQAFPAEVAVVDVLRMARRLLPGLERYALWFVAQHLGIKRQQAHRALEDVELTLAVFRALSDLLQSQGAPTFLSLVSLFGLNSRLLDDITAQKIATIQEALDLGVRVRIKYFSSSAARVSERDVLPRLIKQEAGKQYLVGFCSLRNEERTFRIDGILHVEIAS